jgi:hypothetical protein
VPVVSMGLATDSQCMPARPGPPLARCSPFRRYITSVGHVYSGWLEPRLFWFRLVAKTYFSNV